MTIERLYIGVAAVHGECCMQAHVRSKRFARARTPAAARRALARFQTALETQGFDVDETLLIAVEVPLGRADLLTVRAGSPSRP